MNNRAVWTFVFSHEDPTILGPNELIFLRFLYLKTFLEKILVLLRQTFRNVNLVVCTVADVLGGLRA